MTEREKRLQKLALGYWAGLRLCMSAENLPRLNGIPPRNANYERLQQDLFSDFLGQAQSEGFSYGEFLDACRATRKQR